MRRALLLTLIAGAVLAPVARADGDPASDYLIAQQVFYPYYSNAPKTGLEQLQDTVKAANKAGFTIRVAIITSPYDLGSVSSLWHRPQPYARFLSAELAFAYKNRLLVVTPNGYGYVEATKPVPAKLALVETVPIGKGTDGLLASGDRVVRLLAARAGYTLPAASASGGGSSSSMDTIVIAVAAAVGAALVAAVEVFRRRRRRRPAAAERTGS